jgi:hypothetical protein
VAFFHGSWSFIASAVSDFAFFGDAKGPDIPLLIHFRVLSNAAAMIELLAARPGGKYRDAPVADGCRECAGASNWESETVPSK